MTEQICKGSGCKSGNYKKHLKKTNIRAVRRAWKQYGEVRPYNKYRGYEI